MAPKTAAAAAESTHYVSDDELDARINQRVNQKFNERTREGFIALKTIGQLIIWHPIEHIAAPGVKNKVEGVLGLGGRGLAGYGIYKLVRFGISKITG